MPKWEEAPVVGTPDVPTDAGEGYKPWTPRPGEPWYQAPEVERPNRTPLQFATDLLNTAGRGLTIGASDEIQGVAGGALNAIRGGSFKEGYDQTRARVDEGVENFYEDHPIIAPAAEIAGAVVPSLVPVSVMGRGAGLAGKVVDGVVAGGLQGALYGFNTGEGGVSDRLKNAAGPTMWGAGIGAGVPILARAAAPVTSMIARRFQPKAGAVDVISDALQNAGRPVSDMQADLLRNPVLRPADMDPALQSVLRGVANQPESRSIVGNAIRSSENRQGDSVRNAFDVSVGVPPDTEQLLNGMKFTAANNARRGFTAALANAKPVDVSSVLRTIDDIVSPGVTKVTGLQPGSLNPSQKALLYYRSVLTDGKTYLTDPGRLHELQARIGRQIRTMSDGPGADAGSRYMAAQLRPFHKALVDAIDNASPLVDPANPASGHLYQMARRQYADDMSVEEAFRDAMDIFRNRSGSAGLEDRPEAWRAWFNGLSDAEKDAARLGARTAIDQEMGRVTNAARKGTMLPDIDFNRAKLQIILGPNETARLEQRLGDHRRIADTNTRISGNSETGRNLAATQELQARRSGNAGAVGATVGTALPIVAALLSKDPLTTAAMGIPAAIGLGVKGLGVAARRADQKRNQLLAQLLMEEGGGGAQTLGNAANPKGWRQQLTAEQERLLRALLGAGNRAATPVLVDRYRTGRSF